MAMMTYPGCAGYRSIVSIVSTSMSTMQTHFEVLHPLRLGPAFGKFFVQAPCLLEHCYGIFFTRCVRTLGMITNSPC